MDALPGICSVRSTTADHIIPWRTAPDLRYTRFNLRGACAPCNLRRGNLPVSRIPALRAQLAAELTGQPHRDPRSRARRHIAAKRGSAPALSWFDTKPAGGQGG